MPVIINQGLADASNACLLTTVILYALAMLAYACDFAFRKERLVAPAAVQVPELVGAAAGGTGSPAVPPRAAGPAATTGPASRWPSGFWLRTAFGLTCAGLLTHVAAIVTRGLAEHRVPWGNMYEFIAAIACMAVLVMVAARSASRPTTSACSCCSRWFSHWPST